MKHIISCHFIKSFSFGCEGQPLSLSIFHLCCLCQRVLDEALKDRRDLRQDENMEEDEEAPKFLTAFDFEDEAQGIWTQDDLGFCRLVKYPKVIGDT